MGGFTKCLWGAQEAAHETAALQKLDLKALGYVEKYIYI
jgi:hypothetical protein